MPARNLRSRAFPALLLAAMAVLTLPSGAFGSALFFIKGAGWGNGVGMSQWGAEGYALHGWSYRQILAHYYPHTTISVVAQPLVRVLLAEGKAEVTVGSNAPFLLVDARGRKVHVPARALALTPRLVLGKQRLVPPVDVEPGAQPVTVDGKGYRGWLTLLRTAGKLDVVNTLPLERYLRGVVPWEMPNQWSAQAYEAQAVAARSYALARLKPGSPFDLYPDNRSQMYGGIGAEEPATDLAVGATTGQVLTYGGQVITAYYDSNSGGRTAAVRDVFAGIRPVPYLVSVSDPYDALSPYHRWRVALFAKDVSTRFGMTVDDVRVEHNDSGVVSSVVLLGPDGQKTLTATEFSQALGLRSVRFSVSVVSLADAPVQARPLQPLQLHGFLRDVGGVVLQQRLPNGAWQQLAHVRAGPDGRFVAVVRPGFATAYRLAVDQVPGPALEIAVRR